VTAADRNLAALWRPGTEQPAELGEPALIAMPVEEDGRAFVVVVGFFFWTADGWENEESGKPLGLRDFWWVAERELVAGLVDLTPARRPH